MKIVRTTNDLAQLDIDTNFEIGEFYDLESQPSLTDPSQAMEIKDILNLYSRGGSVRVLRSQQWGEDIPDEFESISTRIHVMDKTEKAQAAMDIKDLINTKAESIDKLKKDLANKKLTKKLKAEAEAEANKKQNPKGDE